MINCIQEEKGGIGKKEKSFAEKDSKHNDKKSGLVNSLALCCWKSPIIPTFAISLVGEGMLVERTKKGIRQSDSENIKLELQDLIDFYASVDASKTSSEIEGVYKKCTDLKKKKNEFCQGPAAQNLVQKLKKKYKQKPITKKLFEPQPKKEPDDSPTSTPGSNKKQPTLNNSKTASKSDDGKSPNLHLATKEQLLEELEKRQDDERDKQVEDEDCEEEDCLEDNASRWIRGSFPEKVIVM